MGANTNRVDDGYRGLLKNPKTGRIFKANRITCCRGDLIRIDSPDQKTEAVKSSDEEFVGTPAVESGATDAFDELLAQSRATDDKDGLKAIGAQLGLSLSKAMSEDTMRERIADRIAEVQAAGE